MLAVLCGERLHGLGRQTREATDVAADLIALRISRKEGHRFTASRSMVSRHVGPLLVKQDVVDFLSRAIIRQ